MWNCSHSCLDLSLSPTSGRLAYSKESSICASQKYHIVQFLMKQNMPCIEKFDGENIDGQHFRPPVLAILLETIWGP